MLKLFIINCHDSCDNDTDGIVQRCLLAQARSS